MSGRIPRLEMDDLRDDLAAALQPRVTRLGYLGEFFKVTGHVPDVLLSFMNFTETLKEALPDRLTEVVALSVAGRTGNAYERHQHERLSLKLGFGEGWVRAVNRLDPDNAPELAEEERAAQRLALAALASHGRDCAGPFEALLRIVGHRQAIAVLLLIGRYATHAIAVNSLALAPPVPSPLAGDQT